MNKKKISCTHSAYKQRKLPHFTSSTTELDISVQIKIAKVTEKFLAKMEELKIEMGKQGEETLKYELGINIDMSLDAAHFKIFSDFFNLLKQNVSLQEKYDIKDLIFLKSGQFLDDIDLHERTGTTDIIFKHKNILLVYNFDLYKNREEIEYKLTVSSDRPTSIDSEDLYNTIFFYAIENSNLKGNYFKFYDRGMRWEVIKLEPRSMDDIYLPDSLNEDIKLFINIYKKTGKMLRYLFSGNPGTCKTESTLVIANELKKEGVTIIKMNPVENLEFKLKIAEVLAPSLVIFDDIDLTLGSRQRGGYSNSLKGFLDVLDGTEKLKDNIGIISTTNSIDLLDLAAQRPGRFDRILSFDDLTRENVKLIILKSLKYNFADDKGKDIFSCDEIENIFYESKVTGAHIYNTIKSLKLRVDINEIELTKEWLIKEVKDDINVIHRIKKLSKDKLGRNRPVGFEFEHDEEIPTPAYESESESKSRR